MKYKYVIVLLLTVFCFQTCAIRQQESNTSLLNEQAQKYLEDYDEFVDTLKVVHPALYEFVNQQYFDERVAQLRDEINEETTDKDFIWKLSETIALVGCGHTSLGFFNQQRDLLTPEEYFPLLTRLIDEKLYVIDHLINGDSVNKGDEITHINGKPVTEIMADVFKHINSQAYIKSGRLRMFNGYNTSYLPYALGFPTQYSVQIRGQRDKLTLQTLKEIPPYVPLFSEKHPCQDDFCLNEIDSETALLTIRHYAYYGERTKIFTDFLDQSFADIQNKGYNNLIIDLRGNLGGPGRVSIHLLKHTLQEPFYYFGRAGSDFGNNELIIPFDANFNGEITVLMNGEGYSSVGHLVSVLKDRERAVFVGQTLGSNQFCTANQKLFTLKNTGFTYTVARNIFFTAVQETNTKARIEPDYPIEQSIEDFFNDKDVVLEKAMMILESNR